MRSRAPDRPAPRTDEKYVRFEAMDGIREMGPAAEPLRPALERLDQDADREVRHRAEITLAALRPRQ
ncbi:MAG: hypothetical protein E6J77_09755 [Deltaproteobacteria bacterium]|nr:MAG: hypothetical protein E6J77_09755 [Deltaproteobacteria bacterium]